MHALRKGQTDAWRLQAGVRGEVRLIERAFGLGQPVMAEVMQFVEAEMARNAA